MLKQGSPSESKTMIFDSVILPSGPFLPQMRLVHQLREGNANINFYTWGNHFEKIAPIIKQDLADTAFKVGATLNRRKGGNSGLMLYADTPSVDNFTSFEDQQDAILKGMQITELLRVWCAGNLHLLEKWSKLIPAF